MTRIRKKCTRHFSKLIAPPLSKNSWRDELLVKRFVAAFKRVSRSAAFAYGDDETNEWTNERTLLSFGRGKIKWQFARERANLLLHSQEFNFHTFNTQISIMRRSTTVRSDFHDRVSSTFSAEMPAKIKPSSLKLKKRVSKESARQTW